MFVRVEVGIRPEFSDPQAEGFLRKLELSHSELRRFVRWARWLDVYTFDIDVSRERMIGAVQEIFGDRVIRWLFTGGLIPSIAGPHGNLLDLLESAPERPGSFWGLERRFRHGVTDPVARTVLEAFEIVLGMKLPAAKTQSGSLLILEGPKLGEERLSAVARDLFCNELIQSWMVLHEDELLGSARFQQEIQKREIPKGLRMVSRAPKLVEEVKLDGVPDQELISLSTRKLWALNLEELHAIRAHYADPAHKLLRSRRGLPENPTDVEMEVIAQTWSEHCKHKIFRAEVSYEGKEEPDTGVGIRIPSEIDGLFGETIAKTTTEIPRPWLLSVFSDNSGIVALDEEQAFCMKVETHNAPSALDPYGGALTGILGVNRDILGSGFGAKPLFNTDVFCIAPPDYAPTLPERVHHPRRILDGIRHGVESGGNQSGIPTINGALVFDSRYLGRPLVYCGTGGLLPRKVGERACESKVIRPGDLIVMAGGRIGKDGIHGATFSSIALDENSPATAVQLGDAITQKRLTDFLIEARDKGLYRTLTDNGAGGLSSSVGELAEVAGGAVMDVIHAKTKYPGLKPFELVVSESQERMTFAVPPGDLAAFQALAERRGVECSVLGEFNESGFLEILYQGKHVAFFKLKFLHGGVPKMKLHGKWGGRPAPPGTVFSRFEQEGGERLLELLARPNIASKEWLIRQYDHEVQGKSVIKPLHVANLGQPVERSGPNDGGVVLAKHDSPLGVAVGCGINPRYSDLDPYLMAQMAVDEAVRNVIAVGAEFGRPESVLAILDNFSWPDPVTDPAKTAALVRACYGMREAALALQAPLISGKDSMKNDFRGRREGKEILISVPPTLLITAIARVRNTHYARTADFKAAGDPIYVLGHHQPGLLGSELHDLCIEKLRDRGGNERQVVLPVESNDRKPRAPKPDWANAWKTYSWLGGTSGKHQKYIRSVHDVSDGGLLVAIAESVLARGFGARIIFPAGEDSWERAFGEGFHTFVVSIDVANAGFVESEWAELGIPFSRLGEVTPTASLQAVRGEGYAATPLWSVPTERLAEAWSRKGSWS